MPPETEALLADVERQIRTGAFCNVTIKPLAALVREQAGEIAALRAACEQLLERVEAADYPPDTAGFLSELNQRAIIQARAALAPQPPSE